MSMRYGMPSTPASVRYSAVCARVSASRMLHFLSRGDSQRNCGHIVVGRRVAAKILNGRKNRVHQLARRPLPRRGHDVDQPLSAELALEGVVGLEHPVGAKHEDVARGEVER